MGRLTGGREVRLPSLRSLLLCFPPNPTQLAPPLASTHVTPPPSPTQHARTHAPHLSPTHPTPSLQTDAVVDIVGYRRHGHNELEDPSPCLPITYARVRAHPPVLHRYRQRLIAEGVVTQEEVDMWQRHLVQELEKGYEQHRAGEFTKGESGEGVWGCCDGVRVAG